MTTWLLTAVVLGLMLFLFRPGELCRFVVKGGVARLTRGRAPGRLVADVQEIVKRAAVPAATIRVVVESGAPVPRVDGEVGEAVLQQLRNVVGQHRTAQFR